MALKKQYQMDVVASGPKFSSAKLVGAKVVVSFSGVGRGLSTKDGQDPISLWRAHHFRWLDEKGI